MDANFSAALHILTIRRCEPKTIRGAWVVGMYKEKIYEFLTAFAVTRCACARCHCQIDGTFEWRQTNGKCKLLTAIQNLPEAVTCILPP